jgi:hypothetical protein
MDRTTQSMQNPVELNGFHRNGDSNQKTRNHNDDVVNRTRSKTGYMDKNMLEIHQLNILDMSEDDKDRSWECTKVLKYCEEIGVDKSMNHKCLVEWNDINMSQSWVNCFVLSLSNPTPVR